MASGFIVLRDGRCLSLVHAIHDEVLRSIAESLDVGSPLRTWLATQTPADDDVDLGYAFVRRAIHVARALASPFTGEYGAPDVVLSGEMIALLQAAARLEAG